MNIKDLNDDFTLITDEEEVASILSCLQPDTEKLHALVDLYPTLFVKTYEGELLTVFGCEYSVPLIDHPLDLLYPL